MKMMLSLFVLLGAFAILVSISMSAEAVMLQLNNTENLADIIGNGGSVDSPLELLNMWDIKKIPASTTVNNASLCLYGVTDSSSGFLDTDFNVSRITDLNWDESITTATANAQTRVNHTYPDINATDAPNWGCVNITTQLLAAREDGTDNLSLRVNDLQTQTITGFTGMFDAFVARGLSIGNNGLWHVNYEDRENTLASGNTPYLTIHHTPVPTVTITSPSNNTKSHNFSTVANFSIVSSIPAETFNYTFYADTNANPTTIINQSNETLAFNWTLTYNFTVPIDGSVNGTYYLKINGTGATSGVFTSEIYTFNISNAPDTTTNVSITTLPASATDVLTGHRNHTCGADSFCGPVVFDTMWYVNGTPLDTGYNVTTLGGVNVTPGANITFSAHSTETGYGVTSWTLWVNSSTANIGDSTPPVIGVPRLVGTNLTMICSDDDSTINKFNYSILLPDTTSVTRASQTDFTFSTSTSVNFNASLLDTEELTPGDYNITNIGCLDGNGNYVSNDTTVDLNFSISNVSVSGIFFQTLAITTDDTTNITINCTSDPKLRVDKINFTIALQTGTVVRSNPSFFTILKDKFVNMVYQLYNTNEAANAGTDNVTQIGCRDTEGNYAENTSTYSIVITSPSAGGSSSGGGGGGVTPERIVERKVEVAVERCGNLVCEACTADSPEDCIDENPLSCPVDCKFFSLDDAFCTPIFNCGNWKQAWFVNGIILLIIGGMVYGNIQSKKRGVKNRLN